MQSSQELIVQPHEVTQNVSRIVANKILHNTIKAYGIFFKNMLNEVYLKRPV